MGKKQGGAILRNSTGATDIVWEENRQLAFSVTNWKCFVFENRNTRLSTIWIANYAVNLQSLITLFAWTASSRKTTCVSWSLAVLSAGPPGVELVPWDFVTPSLTGSPPLHWLQIASEAKLPSQLRDIQWSDQGWQVGTGLFSGEVPARKCHFTFIDVYNSEQMIKPIRC